MVGMVSGNEESGDIFIADFDFVIPTYRDCRLGHFSIGHGQQLTKTGGYGQVVALADSFEHENYLTTLGFTLKKNGCWTYDGN
jgi:hypothetical protein|tara:strand:+ start:1205 stop:1453 length:249 start_codon:yes stop_codon:yes gene_type:complete